MWCSILILESSHPTSWQLQTPILIEALILWSETDMQGFFDQQLCSSSFLEDSDQEDNEQNVISIPYVAGTERGHQKSMQKIWHQNSVQVRTNTCGYLV